MLVMALPPTDILHHALPIAQAVWYPTGGGDVMNPITVKDAAQRLGVTPQRIRQLVRSGELKATRVGMRTLVIDARSLNRLTEKRAQA